MRLALMWMVAAVLCAAGEAAAQPKPGVPGPQFPRDSWAAVEVELEQPGAGYVAHSESGTHSGSVGYVETPWGLGIPYGRLFLNADDGAMANTLYAEAVKLYKAGRYAAAIEWGEQALQVVETTLGPGDASVASCLSLLGVLHELQGEFAQAEPLLQRVLAIREQALGKDAPEVGSALNNLGNLYYSQGKYARAEPLYERALAIREATLGADHPDVAASLNNLALIYQAQGLYVRAEPLLRRALAIREAELGSRHPEVAASLNNLANLYESQRLYAQAEPLLQRALAIREATLGSRHPELSSSLNNLANLYRAQGDYARAEPLYERALSIWEQVLGPNHPDVARALNNLANLYRAQGDYARAEPLYERALAIWEQALGQHHPDVVLSLNNLAQLRLAQNHLAEALPLFTRAFFFSERRLRQEALFFSEARLSNFLQHLRADEERLYALLRAYPEDEDVRRLALSAVLLLKGRATGELADTSHALYRNLGAQDRKLFEQLRNLRGQVATLSFQGSGSATVADYQQRLEKLTQQGDALEAELARHSAPLRALTALPAPTEIVAQVASTLPKDGALVEFIAYVDRPLFVRPGTSGAQPPQSRYLALVLFPSGDIRTVDLGPADPIDLAASRLLEALANHEATYQDSAQALYARAFQPLRPLLGNTRRLFLSPDGQLGLVPFDALYDGRQFLIDSYDFTYATSGRDLLPRTQEVAPSGSVVVLADPDFSAPLPRVASAPKSEQRPAQYTPSAERFLSTLREAGAEHPWTPLPGTRQEAQAIQRLLPQAQLYLGAEATKDHLLHLTTPGVLHLATHGFFLEDAPRPEGSRGVVHFGVLGEDTLAPHPSDPLLRSGLVLVGASPAPGAADAGQSQSGSALVTALELAGLNLWGTQLVVLSACDTGRGDVKRGQGVYGLRRAFVVAGAETVVTSLWKVDDETTSTLMAAYYRYLLAGQGRATALREAMRSLRKTLPHPYYWAPFIALGRDAPLEVRTEPEPPARRVEALDEPAFADFVHHFPSRRL